MADVPKTLFERMTEVARMAGEQIVTKADRDAAEVASRDAPLINPFMNRLWLETAFARHRIATETQSQATIDNAREAFLGMLADAEDYHWELDGDETGDQTTVHLISDWRQFEELAAALGIKSPGYMETWEDAINKAIEAPPIAKAGGQS